MIQYRLMTWALVYTYKPPLPFSKQFCMKFVLNIKRLFPVVVVFTHCWTDVQSEKQSVPK